MKFLTRKTINDFFSLLKREIHFECEVFLIGDSSLVYKGWQGIADQLEITTNIENSKIHLFDEVLQKFKADTGVEIISESPSEIIPLPVGYEKRVIKIDPEGYGSTNGPRFFHFDPYSVSLRFIARGDETDYKMVVKFLQNGWVNFDLMEKMLEELLSAFSFSTIQQDPAEFRRKYKGLTQMFNASKIS